MSGEQPRMPTVQKGLFNFPSFEFVPGLVPLVLISLSPLASLQQSSVPHNPCEHLNVGFFSVFWSPYKPHPRADDLLTFYKTCYTFPSLFSALLFSTGLIFLIVLYHIVSFSRKSCSMRLDRFWTSVYEVFPRRPIRNIFA